MTGTEKNQDILEKQVEKHLILSIGSNLNSSKGDRFYNIKKAVSFLNSSQIRVQKQSSFYETPSYPDKTKPKFINIVIFAKTKLKKPKEKEIELETELLDFKEFASPKKEEIERIVLVKVPTEIYPTLYETFVYLFSQAGIKNITMEKEVNFEKMYEEKIKS